MSVYLSICCLHSAWSTWLLIGYSTSTLVLDSRLQWCLTAYKVNFGQSTVYSAVLYSTGYRGVLYSTVYSAVLYSTVYIAVIYSTGYIAASSNFIIFLLKYTVIVDLLVRCTVLYFNSPCYANVVSVWYRPIEERKQQDKMTTAQIYSNNKNQFQRCV